MAGGSRRPARPTMPTATGSTRSGSASARPDSLRTVPYLSNSRLTLYTLPKYIGPSPTSRSRNQKVSRASTGLPPSRIAVTLAAEKAPPAPIPPQSRNHLLAVIPASEFRELKAHLTTVDLRAKDRLAETNRPIEMVYFPLDAVLSMAAVDR